MNVDYLMQLPDRSCAIVPTEIIIPSNYIYLPTSQKLNIFALLFKKKNDRKFKDKITMKINES